MYALLFARWALDAQETGNASKAGYDALLGC